MIFHLHLNRSRRGWKQTTSVWILLLGMGPARRGVHVSCPIFSNSTEADQYTRFMEGLLTADYGAVHHQWPHPIHNAAPIGSFPRTRISHIGEWLACNTAPPLVIRNKLYTWDIYWKNAGIGDVSDGRISVGSQVSILISKL